MPSCGIPVKYGAILCFICEFAFHDLLCKTFLQTLMEIYDVSQVQTSHIDIYIYIYIFGLFVFQ